MAETITLHPSEDVSKWLWYHVMTDLMEQGQMEDVSINPLTVTPEGCGGEYLGIKFYISWVKDAFLLLSMTEYSDAIVRGFANVVEYEPFCRYTEDNGLLTVEWDKLDPEGRFKELETEGKTDLTKFELHHPPAVAQ